MFKNIYYTRILFAYFTNFIRIFMRIFKPIYSHKSLDSSHDSQLSASARQLLCRFDELKLVDDLLVRSVSRNGKSFEHAVIPRALQPEILHAFHDDPTGGHLSHDKMLGKMRTVFLARTD